MPGAAAGFARLAAGAALREVFSASPHTLQAIAGEGDAGLFGPDSVAWRVHGHPSALVGGIRSLIVQTLHPLAMAGVAEHSDYRSDPIGRLRRTTAFVAATTYGATAQAEAAVAAVRRVHERVRGTAPDGRRYDANDPDLLAWVHHVEVESFLLAYKRVGPGLSPAEADCYVEEMARLGDLMGARSPLTKARPLMDWVRHHPEVRVTPEARSAARFLVGLPLPLAARPAYAVLLSAAISLVPLRRRWELGLLLPGPVTGRFACEPAARGLLAAMGWALGPSPALANARVRLAANAASAGAVRGQGVGRP
jgi:uncharacterized protein (DUF2236 family)